ncbi:MAG: cell division protein FtsA [Firmicutes bacterium]|nr:cell division protein FtsA [Bacillota bacterium]
MARRRIVGGLDVGTTKVCTCIAEIGSDGGLSIIGVGVCPSQGMRRGGVVDLEATVRSIQESTALAQQMAGVQLERVTLGVSGPHISSLNSSGVIAVAGSGGEIRPEDTERVLQAARAVRIAPDREVLHVLPREFIVDGCKGIRDPVGMAGVRLEAVVHIVTAAVSHTQNLIKAVERAGLEAAELVLPSLAAAEAVLTAKEREMGIALVDIGGGTTDIAVFLDGRPIHTGVVPVGGHHVTNDIAVGLQLPIDKAEELKLQYGSAVRELAATRTGSVGRLSNGRTSLMDIVGPRIEELFQLIQVEIERTASLQLIPGGIVLCGGGALLDGMTEAAREQLGVPARLGVPEGWAGLADVVRSPVYATAVGLAVFAGRQSIAGQARSNGRAIGGWLERIKEWLSNFL